VNFAPAAQGEVKIKQGRNRGGAPGGAWGGLRAQPKVVGAGTAAAGDGEVLPVDLHLEDFVSVLPVAQQDVFQFAFGKWPEAFSAGEGAHIRTDGISHCIEAGEGHAKMVGGKEGGMHHRPHFGSGEDRRWQRPVRVGRWELCIPTRPKAARCNKSQYPNGSHLWMRERKTH